MRIPDGSHAHFTAWSEADACGVAKQQTPAPQVFGDRVVEQLRKLADRHVLWHKAVTVGVVNVTMEDVAAQFREPNDLYEQFRDVIGNQ